MSELSKLNVLALDCQATGANPSNGHLIEIGWLGFRASDAMETIEGNFSDVIESYLCQLPEGEDLPRRVSQLTGITREELSHGVSSQWIQEKLWDAGRQTARKNTSSLCPLIIHFSRYEEPFLSHLHQQHNPEEPFPFTPICTHQIARRLFPQLPSKSLRAIAGYFGHPAHELRRSAQHVAATAFIWSHAVRLLEEKGIVTFDALREWLDQSPIGKHPDEKFFPLDKKIRSDLPHKPGVYRMLCSNGDILYIGKATSLKQRVNSYFCKKNRRGGFIAEMLSQAHDLNTTVTGSALEAALLETDEIKRYSPPYNIALKQKEREIVFFSRDLSRRSSVPDDAHPIGPFPSSKFPTALAAIIRILDGPWIKDSNPLAEEEARALACEVLGLLSPIDAPDAQTFQDGIHLFLETYGEILTPFKGQMLRGLMILGQQLHLDYLEYLASLKASTEEAEPEDNDIEDRNDEGETADDEPRKWTPDMVQTFMEFIIRHSALLIRRARWFCVLSESALTWKSGETSGNGHRLLVFRNGAIVQQENVDAEAPVPVPPGYPLSFQERKQNIDILTYDRLRVLTTELRRLAADPITCARNVHVRLSPSTLLDRAALTRLFQLV
ncbi:MAG: GIY-YIG nuclease family protein [Candidatus Omnitrophota bacterium]